MDQLQQLMGLLYRYFPIPAHEMPKHAHWVSYSHSTYCFKLWLGPEDPAVEFGIGDGYNIFEIFGVLQDMVKRFQAGKETRDKKGVKAQELLRSWKSLTKLEQERILTTLSMYPTPLELIDLNVWPGQWLTAHRFASEDEVTRLQSVMSELLQEKQSDHQPVPGKT